MSSSTISASELPTNDDTVGPILIGGAVSFVLYGCTCLQAFIYQQRYPNDRPLIKWGVLVLWLVDTFDVALTLQICYYYLVTNHLNAAAIFYPTWSLKLHVFVTSLSDFIVRSMFVKRIYAVSHRNLPIAILIGALSLLDLIIGTVITVKAFKIATFDGLTAVATLFNVNFGTNIAADTCVAVCLTYFLWVNRTGSQRTDSLVNKLVLYSVTTGALTVIDAALGLATYLTNPTTLIFIAFYLNLSKIYVNSYFASLNVRKNLLGSIRTQNLVSFQLTGATTGERMPDFRHPDTVTNSAVDEMTSKIESLNTLESGTSCGKRTGGGESSMTSATAVETPTSAIPLVRHGLGFGHGRHRVDSIYENENGGEDWKTGYEAGTGGDGREDERNAGLEVDVDAYRGEIDPELAYTHVHAHRRSSSIPIGERRLSFGAAEGRRSNASGR